MFATIYLPDFYLQAAMRHQPDLRDRPVALIDTIRTKVLITQLNEPAQKAGIDRGMTPSQALARCLQVAIKTRERARENVIDEILLQHAFTLSPLVEATGPGLCTVQFTDNRGLEKKVARVMAKLSECELVSQAGIAPTPDTSFLAAHRASPLLQIADMTQFLGSLPLDVLAIAC